MKCIKETFLFAICTKVNKMEQYFKINSDRKRSKKHEIVEWIVYSFRRTAGIPFTIISG